MKFSIRDLLLVTVIVAVCAAWWVDRSRLATEIEERREAMFKRAADLDAEISKLIKAHFPDNSPFDTSPSPEIEKLMEAERGDDGSPGHIETLHAVLKALAAKKKSGELKGCNIELDMQDGTVQLVGRVTSEDQRLMVVETVRNINGVKRIVDELTVDTP